MSAELLEKVIPLLKSAEGQRILLAPPQERKLGFFVDKQNFRLGNISFEALDYEVPVPAMYEGFDGGDGQDGRGTEEDKCKARIIREELTVLLPLPTPFLKDSFALVDARVWPVQRRGEQSKQPTFCECQLLEGRRGRGCC